jgi:hypothetical protein
MALSSNYTTQLLSKLSDMAGANTPNFKITPTGFVKSVMENNPSFSGVKLNTASGHTRTVELRYQRRLTDAEISTTDTCDVSIRPEWFNATLEATNVAKTSFHISNEDMAAYVEESTASYSIGGVSMFQEHLSSLLSSANGLISKIDKTLMNSLTYGKNIATGNTSAASINFAQSTTTNVLNTGMSEILDECMTNEMYGDLIMFGSGNFNKWYLQQGYAGLAATGLDQSKVSGFKWYYDPYSASATGLGANKIGVYSKGSVGFVDIDKYVGFQAGKLGNSTFFQITLPVETAQNDGSVQMMKFNCQLQEVDCPTEMPSGYSTVTIDRGYIMHISKQYGLFQIPSGAYQSNDRLYGNNGLLRFEITNS